jgi:hypothetical protein
VQALPDFDSTDSQLPEDIRINIDNKATNLTLYEKQVMLKSHGRYDEEADNTIKQVNRKLLNQPGVWKTEDLSVRDDLASDSSNTFQRAESNHTTFKQPEV